MKILHASFECYPIAKVGGLADVVGSLPKYQSNLNVKTLVVIPYYEKSFVKQQKLKEVSSGSILLDNTDYNYKVFSISGDKIKNDICLIHITNLLDREEVYGYQDENNRYLSFQFALLDWIIKDELTFDVIHCHDHHTALIPFLINYGYSYEKLRGTPTVLTIHNAQYQGHFSHEKLDMLPAFDFKHVGLLDWYGSVNPLACGIKCASRVNTVSPSYMNELKERANGLEGLLRSESEKCVGILNGIDTDFWNTETDDMLVKNYKETTVVSGKKANKKELCDRYGFNVDLPLFGFIGRLVGEKSADLLPEAIRQSINEYKEINVFVLGSGHKEIENQLKQIKEELPGKFNAHIGYDEELSHLVYAGSDFLLMPSRVEPCGLNQMYSLRYGTIPIVRRTGGLKDTVIDIGDAGFGICHDQPRVWDIYYSIGRAITLYKDTDTFRKIQKNIMKIDHSWEKSAQDYIDLYKSI
ncbi:glycogen synthase [Tenacibaculum agarivorans]|uniref:glycogen synthase n=1 Tax=Tenacibaculum agarivorans TaxID=1908389 RepID=UPI00094B9213|nr:glycogen/starch synthase [Tenacibaculum agarivorans]